MSRRLFALVLVCLVSGPAAFAQPQTETASENDSEISTTTIHQGDETSDDIPCEELAGGGESGGAVASFDPATANVPGRSITEAALVYEQAVTSYSNGNHARAGQLYRQALCLLSSANIDPGIQYQLSEDFGNLFNKLKRLLGGCRQEDAGDGYSIPMNADNELVQKYCRLYSRGGGRDEMRRALERGASYRNLILGILREYDLPEELVYLPVIESFYDNDCLSRAGALGLWQLMPERARSLGLKVNSWIDERKDPEKATRAACRYLKELYQMFDDWHMALAAYNRGEFGLLRDLENSRATSLREISLRKAVPQETEYFVPQFIACTLIAGDPGRYGLAEVPVRPLVYDRVIVNEVIDLKVAAACAGTTIGEIRRLNPALKAWCTPYRYPGFELHVPPGARALFLKNIARVKDRNPFQGCIKYRVARGDCLDLIARKYGTTVDDIRRINKLRELRRLQVGQVLVIRPGKDYPANAGE